MLSKLKHVGQTPRSSPIVYTSRSPISSWCLASPGNVQALSHVIVSRRSGSDTEGRRTMDVVRDVGGRPKRIRRGIVMPKVGSLRGSRRMGRELTRNLCSLRVGRLWLRREL
jgi:hypothetical protein